MMALALAAAALVQMAVPPVALLGLAKVPVLLGVALYYALTRPAGVALGAAFLAGLLQDALSPVPLGHSAFCFVLAAALAGRFRRTVLADAAVTAALFGALAAAATTLASYGLLARAGLTSWPAGRLLVKGLGTGMLGALVTPAVFAAVRRLDGRVGLAPEAREYDGLG
jgi:rod shape-determining protein MreD